MTIMKTDTVDLIVARTMLKSAITSLNEALKILGYKPLEAL